MCLLGSIAELRQFFLDIVIDQNIERNRPAKSMLQVESLPKSVEPAKRVSTCWILAQRTDDLCSPAALPFRSGLVVAIFPDIFRPNSFPSGQTSVLIPVSRVHALLLWFSPPQLTERV
jgi:hypothetical protein